MTRYEFMENLKNGIKSMPEPDRTDAISYYEEYFDEAGEENEAKVIEELGNPYAISARLMAEYAYNKTQEREKIKSKNNLKYIWMILLGICASPIAIPLVITIAALVFSLLVVVFSFAFVFVAIALSFIVGGIVAFVAGIIMIFINPPSGILGIGASLLLMGIGILAAELFWTVIFRLLPIITREIGKIFKKTSGGLK